MASVNYAKEAARLLAAGLAADAQAAALVSLAQSLDILAREATVSLADLAKYFCGEDDDDPRYELSETPGLARPDVIVHDIGGEG